jgi:hypothetical protein
VWRDRLRTTLIVVLLTGLIWFFADQAATDSKTISLQLSVQPPDDTYLIVGQDPDPLKFEVSFRAPRGVIREIDDELRVRPLNPTFVLDRPDRNQRYAKLTFESMKVLQQIEAVRQRGLSITSVHPSSFTVEIDSMIHRTMRIKPEFGQMVVEQDEPRPPTVDVILPSRMADELPGDTLAVDATRYVDAGKLYQQQHATVELQWSRGGPQAKFVHFEPPTFDVRFRLKDTTAQRSFQSVPVSFSATYEVLSRYTPVPVDPAEFRPDVVVAGPKQLIDNLRKEDIKLVVDVYASDEATIGQPITRQIKVQSLPASVQILSQLRDVRFTLQDKTGP